MTHKWRKQEFRASAKEERLIPIEIHSNPGEALTFHDM